ncbi:hypothetical protein UNDKW_3981 [Undibacterium sp. KW1]|uniref:flagellar basal body P-ring formation chaperone FlgA n=1 Tax=Undibacterium sp. KW1 TaxID=2058624 RepID=UPI001331D21F|nr:flagellar basal body P-ring formation chaperone FlgA [Undibacterium sp. KW1]BBB62254.1 hypothetical protein UNDKW_3981 [Undibacterium sp. KW1]
MNSARIALQVLFAWCLLADIAAAKTVQLELRSVVQVKSARLVLADVVNVDAATQREEAQLLALPIGTMSLTAGNMVVQRKALEKWVRQHAGARSRDIHWVGADAVNIMLQTQIVDAAKVRSHARAVLEEWISLNVRDAGSSDIAIRDQGELQALVVPAGEVKVRISHLSEPLSLRSKLTVLLDVLISDQVVKSVPVLFELSGSRQAFIARHDIARGGAVSEADVELREVDIFADVNEPVSPITFAKTAVRAKTGLHKGAILNRANIETVPDVARGEFVVLLARDGLVSIESRVEAMQDGYVGQIIKVRPGNSNNQIPAKIIEPGKVELR